MRKIFTQAAVASAVLAAGIGWFLCSSAPRVPVGAPLVVRVRPYIARTRAAAGQRANTHRAAPRPAAPPVAGAAASILPDGFAAAFPAVAGPVRRWTDFRPASLTVAPYPDLPVTFDCVAVREERGVVVWIGRNPGLPGASYVGVATATGYDGILIVPGASQFGFHVHGGGLVVQESSPGEETCAAVPGLPAARLTALAGGGLAAVRSGDTGGLTLPAAADLSPAAAHVDVLFLYDAQALSYAALQYSDPTGFIAGNCRALIESANLVLQQSGVTQFQWRYLGAVQSPVYKRTGILFDDLTQLSPGGAIGDWVAARRYEYSADQIMLLTGGNTDAFGWANLAAGGQPIDGPHAISVMRNDGSYRMMAHELAHNFGCRHERADSGGTGVAAPEGNGLWCYGWRWTDPPDPANPGASATTSGTIMAYADYIVPYYSNPNITLQITASLEDRPGNPALGSMTIGRPETAVDAAYNVRILNDNAASLVNVSPELATPVITQPPQGAALTAGQALNLSVTATGGGLFYQWLRNGAAIPSATAAQFSRAAVGSADAGDYTVQVTNRAGSVVSSAATVTVTGSNPAPAPQPSSGGGGGGGAPSPIFLAALVLIVMARSGRWTRRSLALDRA